MSAAESVHAGLTIAMSPLRPRVDFGSPDSTLSALVVRGLLHAVEHAGVVRSDFLRAAQLDPLPLESQTARLPRSEVYRLCELALSMTGDPALGLHWAERLTERMFAPVSHLIINGASLRRAFELLAQFYPLLSDEADYEIVESADSVTLLCRRMDASERVQRFTAEMMTLGFWQLILCFHMRARPRCVSFEHAAPPYRAEYTRLFAGMERFQQGFTGLVFDLTLLDTSSQERDDGVREALQSLAEQRLQRITQSTTHAQRVREHLLGDGWPHRIDMKSIARALATSVRSLRRRLRDEGTSYNEVLNETLTTIAKNRLQVRRNTIQEVAYEMGFSDVSSFHRAFKRWTGTTPSSYRESLDKE